MNKYISIALIIGIVLVLNMLSKELFFRLDLTENRQYTLSKATRDILRGLDEVVTVKAFFSDGMPPDYAKLKNDLRDLLVEYERLSGGNVSYNFADPGDETAFQQAAAEEGVPSFSMQVREKDKLELKNVHLGVSVSVGDRKEVIPQFDPNSPLEYIFTMVIKKLSVVDKPSVGLVQGHGEPSFSELGQVLNGLNVLYNVENLTLEEEIAGRFKTIMIIGPSDSFPESHLQRLDEFLGRGGNIFAAINRAEGDLNSQMPQGIGITTGLEGWLEAKGIAVEEALVADANFGTTLTMQTPTQHPIFGQVIQQTQVPFHYVPAIKNFDADNPAVSGLDAVILQFASPIRYTGQNPAVRYQPVAFTSSQSNSFPLPHFFNFQRKWTQADFPMSSLAVAAVLEGPIAGNANSRLFVVSDGDFAVNRSGNPNARLPEGNVNLLVNAVDWLSDDTGLINLRTRAVATRPIDEIEDSKRAAYKWLNFLLPLLAVIVVGVVRMQRQRSRRMKRMQERYV
jgi:gliding-associated putative ABC transporter substrate-binding component GldG